MIKSIYFHVLAVSCWFRPFSLWRELGWTLFKRMYWFLSDFLNLGLEDLLSRRLLVIYFVLLMAFCCRDFTWWFGEVGGVHSGLSMDVHLNGIYKASKRVLNVLLCPCSLFCRSFGGRFDVNPWPQLAANSPDWTPIDFVGCRPELNNAIRVVECCLYLTAVLSADPTTGPPSGSVGEGLDPRPPPGRAVKGTWGEWWLCE